MINIKEIMNIFKLKDLGYSISSIAREVGKDRKTIRKYLKKGKIEIPKFKERKKKGSKLDKYMEAIKNLLNMGETRNETVSAVVIYDKIKKMGYEGSLSLLRKMISKEKDLIIMRLKPIINTLAGEQSQVDWGEKYLVDENGKKHKVYIFCMVLSYSRMRFVKFYPKANRYYFLLGHIEAFSFFKGVPKSILYDQSKCAVDKPGFKKVTLNKKFDEFAIHYGFYPGFCKPYRPRTKGKVENMVKYVKNNFLVLRNFINYEILNDEGREWINDKNNSIHSSLNKIPLEVFNSEEKDKLNPLPEGKYEIYELETRKVLDTATISFGNTYYSVPVSYIGKHVTCKLYYDKKVLYIYHQDKFLCKHNITKDKQKYVIKEKHRKEVFDYWRNDLKTFYILPKMKKSKVIDNNINRPLSYYEEGEKDG